MFVYVCYAWLSLFITVLVQWMVLCSLWSCAVDSLVKLQAFQAVWEATTDMTTSAHSDRLRKKPLGNEMTRSVCVCVCVSCDWDGRLHFNKSTWWQNMYSKQHCFFKLTWVRRRLKLALACYLVCFIHFCWSVLKPVFFTKCTLGRYSFGRANNSRQVWKRPQQ